MARHAMRGLIQSGLASRARWFHDGARIVVFVGPSLLSCCAQAGFLFWAIFGPCASDATFVACRIAELCQNTIRNLGGITDDANAECPWSARSGQG